MEPSHQKNPEVSRLLFDIVGTFLPDEQVFCGAFGLYDGERSAEGDFTIAFTSAFSTQAYLQRPVSQTESPGTGSSADRFPIPGFKGQSLEHRRAKELSDEVLHTGPLIGKVICDKREGVQGPVSLLCKFRLDSGSIQFLQKICSLPHRQQ